MTESLLEMAKQLTQAQIQAGNVPPEETKAVLNATFETLRQLRAREPSEWPEPVATTPMDWKKSITKQAVICLECGTTFKQLSNRHLRTHELDSRSYRIKYGIPQTQSLAAREVSARRRAIVQQSRPWEKSRTYPKQKPVKPVQTKRSRLKKAS